jgi:hypothetical protein
MDLGRIKEWGEDFYPWDQERFGEFLIFED